jgi:hypothetical protein
LVDWFRFWLKNEEDPDPAKAEQYKRWRELNVRLIGESRKKDDRMDARTLARLARIDPQLLCPVKHHSAKAQADLTVIRARAGLVRARTALVNTARGLAKSYGERLRGCPQGGKQRFQLFECFMTGAP